MARQQIIISVPADPSKGITIDVNGVVGPGCKGLTERLEGALGNAKSEELKDEYQQRDSTQEERQAQ